jgi:lipoyl(octanoyl) transferase
VTTHGFALNVNTDLSYFTQIVACGLADAGVTSMQAVTGRPIPIDEVENEIVTAFAGSFAVEVVGGDGSASPAPETRREEAAIGR